MNSRRAEKRVSDSLFTITLRGKVVYVNYSKYENSRLSFDLFIKWVRYTRRSTCESGNPLRPAAAFRQACHDALPALE